MKTVAVIFGLIFLVYLAAWLGSLDMAARIAALLLIAVKLWGWERWWSFAGRSRNSGTGWKKSWMP